MLMDEKLQILTKDLTLNSHTSKDLIEMVERKLDIDLPKDYVSFMMESNGGEGFIGDAYLMLWPVDELPEYNEGYHVAEFAPGLLLIGSNGSNEAYGFDLTEDNMPIVNVPFIGMSTEVRVTIADSFIGFLEYLSAN